ncbi:uncharacterized protein I206_107241 [Kwoniella pini CBS 10737]|uniref:Uncharacterized protein n=1 Tax=Kwoniella pini CBS 10737 TaxID=1296096 RepID=A0A1B9HYT6_9TREE|nr:uncharacterized protein I206_05214 [Kwoniella pini CBS 10737]OCF48436.1 hypothetical protein I206_05214 [Kwoniella pini CBS 10737]
MPEVTNFISKDYSSSNSIEYLKNLSKYQKRLKDENNNKGKIIGLNHYADEIPLNNSERIKRGLPLKPPTNFIQKSIKREEKQRQKQRRLLNY